MLPRLKQFTVVGVFESGHYEYDSSLAMIDIADAEALFRLPAPTGVRLRLHDMQKAPEVTRELARSLSGDLYIRDWTQQNQTWFSAVQIEKRMMFIILTLIIAVAAFNLVVLARDDRDRQAARYRDPAHARRTAALDHENLLRAGRDDRLHRHRARRCARPARSRRASRPSCR